MNQCLRRNQCLGHVRKQGSFVTKYLKLDQTVAIEQFPGKPTGTHCGLRIVTAGRIGQNGVSTRRNDFEQIWCVGFLADIRATDRDGDNLGTACLDRATRLLEVLILARADQQPRGIAAACNNKIAILSGGGHV